MMYLEDEILRVDLRVNFLGETVPELLIRGRGRGGDRRASQFVHR